MTNPCSTSKVSHSDFAAIVQSNSSPEAIAASLNEAEVTASRLLGTLHGNAKRAYPWWKTCAVCLAPFPCLNRTQAARNAACSSGCAHALQSRGRAPRGRSPDAWVPMTCSECGVTFERRRAWARSTTARPVCSRQCNGKARMRSLLVHPNFAAGKTSPEAIAKRVAKMRGPNNPAWKGGVTLVQRCGNYPKRERLVRCPPEFASMARSNGYVLEHRLVVAAVLGRVLLAMEVVHHENHDPMDNRQENLTLFSSNRDHKLYEAHGSPAPLWSGSSP